MVAGHYWTAWVLGPRSGWIERAEEPHRIVTRWLAAEHPPSSAVHKNAGIDKRAPQQPCDSPPAIREFGGPIELNRLEFERFRDHVVLAATGEHVGIGKVRLFA